MVHVFQLLTKCTKKTKYDHKFCGYHDSFDDENHMILVNISEILPDHLYIMMIAWIVAIWKTRPKLLSVARYDFICIVQVIDLRNIVCVIGDFLRLFFFTCSHYEKRQTVQHYWWFLHCVSDTVDHSEKTRFSKTDCIGPWVL